MICSQKVMKKEAKQTIISLSLAGAIGYYLYNKLIKAGKGPSMIGADHESAADKTKSELSWRPEPVLEVPVVEELEVPEDIFAEENVADVVDANPVEEIAEDVIEEEVAEEIAEDATDEEISEEVVDIGGRVCADCGALNVGDANVCEYCGASFVMPVDEIVEDAVDIPVIEEPVIESDDVVLEEPVLEIDKIEEEFVIGEEVVEEVAEASDVEDDADANEEEDTPIDDLFEAVKEDEPEEVVEQTVMDNVEPLHKVDNKDPSAKKEFKSIMDFFKTL